MTRYGNLRKYEKPQLYAGVAQQVEHLTCLSNLLGNKIMNELTSKQKGNLTELQCITAFYKLGYSVSIPYGENSRYDFIADVNGELLKIQVKTSRVKKENEAIIFTCRSTNVNTKGTVYHRYNKEQIDYFATFWNEKCYLVPVEECSVEKTLRFCYPSNGQKKGITLAEEYELEKVLNRRFNE